MAKLKEECGVAGVIGDSEAANLIYLSLYALQHRGQEACGIVTFEGENKYHNHKSFGLVGDGFNKDILATLKGSMGLGHNRYSTFGGRLLQNIQPFYFNTPLGGTAIAHNGNVTNADSLQKELEEKGSIFQSTSDSEVFMHLLARSKKTSILERTKDAAEIAKGAFSLIVLHNESMIAVRDPFGFRPLVLGKKGEAFIVVSETCALDLIGAEYIRDVEPGEILEITRSGMMTSEFISRKVTKSFCSFEPIYFARPDSLIAGKSIYHFRKRMGQILSEESDVEADVVIAVPDSGVPMAMGYSEKSGIPLELGLVRNHYVGRTFIEPSQSIRDFGVKLKLNPVTNVLKGKRVVVVDDSLVRGTTSIKILRMIRQAGAKEIHFRLGSPPITHSCYFGVDTPSRDQLLAAQKNIEKIRKYIGADTLAFLSNEGLKKALESSNYCMGCFTGNYPEEIFRQIPGAPTDDMGGPGYDAGLPQEDLKKAKN